jgi:hypothetical protein
MDWIKIYTTANAPKAEIIKGMLNEHCINANILNKRDSEFPSLGDVEIYVEKSNESQAKQLIDEHNQPE